MFSLTLTLFLGQALPATGSGSGPRLHSPTLTRLRTGATKPAGWLERELTLQAKGVSGQLPYFWSYFNHSAWMDAGRNEPHQFIPY